MKVTLVARRPDALPSGVGTYVRNLGRELALRCTLRRATLGPGGIRLGGRSIGGTLTRLYRENLAPVGLGSDIVHASDITSLHPRCNVMTLMDLVPFKTPDHPRERRLYERKRGRIRRLERIVTLTDCVADEAAEEFDLPRERFAAVHLAVDHEQFHPDPVRPIELPADRVNLLFVGELRPRKRFHLLVEALAHLDRCRLVRLGPIGTHPAVVAYAARCRETAARLGVDVVDAGYAPAAHLRRYYTHADLAVFPSADEGFGLPPLEAMACGTPALVSDIPPHREVYGDQVAYLDATTPEAVAHAVRSALARPRDAAACTAFATRFTWAATAERTLDVYRSIR